MDAATAAWLARTVETPIDPDREIVDPHHHLWDRPNRRYLVEDLHADTGAGHNVVATVFVECASEYRDGGPEHLRPVGETDFVAEQARQSRERSGAPIAGIVSFADLALGAAVEEVLIAHDDAGNGLFKGIRHATSWDEELGAGHTDSPPGLMATAAFRQGFATLGAMGFRFDAWLYHPQLPDLVDLCRAHPEVPVILDHIGAPMGVGRFRDRRDEVRAAWQPPMRELAACENVVLKVGGIGMNRYYGGGWPERDAPPSSAELEDYWGDDLRWCIDLFGPDRCMFESNFPVDRESCSYTVLWNVYQRIGRHYSDVEQAALFAGTARRVYALD